MNGGVGVFVFGVVFSPLSSFLFSFVARPRREGVTLPLFHLSLAPAIVSPSDFEPSGERQRDACEREKRRESERRRGRRRITSSSSERGERTKKKVQRRWRRPRRRRKGATPSLSSSLLAPIPLFSPRSLWWVRCGPLGARKRATCGEIKPSSSFILTFPPLPPLLFLKKLQPST